MIKEWRGGKYRAQKLGPGHFGNNDAGVKRFPGVGGEPTKREFIGSNFKEYTFSDKLHGTHTIVAESYKEALRIAKTLGFTKKDYQRKRRHKG